MSEPPSSPVAPASTATRRQARAVVTRTAILDAASAEFALHGYQAASLSRILERSGVTKGALYFHFTSKEAVAECIVEVMEQHLPLVLAEVEGRGHDGLTTAVHLAIGLADFLDAVPEAKAGLRITNEGALGEQRRAWPYRFWEDAFTSLLCRARREGRLRDDVGDVAALARTIVALGVGHRSISTATVGLTDLRERVEASWALLLPRIGTEAWLEGFDAAGGMASLPPGTGGG